MFRKVKILSGRFVQQQRKYALVNKHTKIYTGRVNGVGVVTVKNGIEESTNFSEISRTVNDTFEKWIKDGGLQLIVMNVATEGVYGLGNGLGGLTEIATGDSNAEEYFEQCYTLTNQLAKHPIPRVAIFDGKVIASGTALAMNNVYRVATENAVFSHPEVKYGFYPDNGAIVYLSKEPGALGQYLALTGRDLRGRDLYKAGFATHFVASRGIPNLFQDLLSLKHVDEHDLHLRLRKHHDQWQGDFNREFSLKSAIGRMNITFGRTSMEAIFAALEKDPSTFTKNALEQMKMASPTSLKLTLKMFEKCKGMSLNDCLKLEYNVSLNIVKTEDFKHGVLNNKNNGQCKWSPATIAEVSDEYIASFFAPNSNPGLRLQPDKTEELITK